MYTDAPVSATVSVERVDWVNPIYLRLNQFNQGLVLLDLDYFVLTLLFCPDCFRCNSWDTVLYFDQSQDKQLE